jgi:transcriptional regulator with XRE-family HTH domain
MNSVFSENLRRLRQSKGYTQEQVADYLGVSPQSISRWECGSTFPDILLLPTIAEFYCTTVDDLFREGANAYKHYVDRLSSLFESTRDRDDYIRADNEYRRLIDSGNHTSEDLRSYGCMHMMAMWECADKAMMAFNEVIARGPEEEPRTYYRTRLQKMQLIHSLGHNKLNLERQRAALDAHPEEPWEHILMLAALCNAKQYEDALQLFFSAIENHPNASELYIYGGEICKALGRLEEAFSWLDKGLAVDPELCDAKYAKANWYEETGNFSQAMDT